MMVGSPRRTRRRVTAMAMAAAVLLGACDNAAEPRPTDPHEILVRAVAATAGLTTVRIHIEVASDMGAAMNGQLGGPVNVPREAMMMTMTLDADVDLPTRQLTGRTVTQMPQMVLANGGPAQRVSDMIITQAATFNRDSQTGRWMKFPAGAGGIGGAPTNLQIAAAVTKLLADPSLGLERGDPAPCTLGTCDHVVAHVDGERAGAVFAGAFGIPLMAAAGAAIPDFVIDLLVDQATSVISEARTEISANGSATRLLMTLNNLGQSIQIAPPPAALTDDFGANFGGGGLLGGFDGGTTTTILESVGNEIDPQEPSSAESPSAP